ncbi:IS4 family transposase [Dactylosporangium sp. CA-152071]|uniref:IS4 family transposase n=1 Tax=Dactylosporangium sp. CA-152071 TaxID=3239933 RepID=UPI003D92292A
MSQVVPGSLIDEAVAATGVGQRRVRLLPARLVVLFVLAMVVFSGNGYTHVWRQMVSGWPGLARLAPTRSAFTQARRRLGEAPLAWLFTRLRGACGQAHTPGVFAFGLRKVAWDGTTITVPDSPGNAEAFGRSRGGGGNVGGYPRLWLNVLIECGTRAVVAAAFGHGGEVALAGHLLGGLGPDMLLLADRNFCSYQLWQQARARGAHLLWRVKADRLLPVHHVLPDGSWLSRINPSRAERAAGATAITVRVVRYAITITTTGPHGRTSRREHVRLMTSLLDPDLASAADLAACYHERWEQETGYADLKTWLRGPDVILRSRQPQDVRQELWAHLIVYQTLRHLITDIATSQHLDPDTLSFLTCLRIIQLKITNLAIVAGQPMTEALLELEDHLLTEQIPTRRTRSSPRVVKRPTKPYPSKKPGVTSTHATYTIETLPPATQETA